MARLNVAQHAAATLPPVYEEGAKQTFNPVAELERLVSCCLLGERQFYVDGNDIAEAIAKLATKHVGVSAVSGIAVRARTELGLRHVPLLLLVCMAGRDGGPGILIREAASKILRTPKDAMDLVALYWAKGKRPLPHSFKAAIRDGFARWTDYQICKYATLTNVSVRLRDLAFMAHPNGADRVDLFRDLANDALKAPDTWEAALSRGDDKRGTWERLLGENKLGALALVRNLRNMEQVGVKPALVRAALAWTKSSDVWPWQALAAAREAPAYAHDLDELMLRSCGSLPRLPGKTGVLVDVSGSMNSSLSERGSMMRFDAAAGLAVVLDQVCEEAVIASFSNKLAVLTAPRPRGSALAKAIIDSQPHGGTLLGQAVQTLLYHHRGFDRLVILTDEQAQDRASSPIIPTFVVNLASYQCGISWQGPVTRINGWSGGVIRYIAQEVAGATPAASDENDD